MSLLFVKKTENVNCCCGCRRYITWTQSGQVKTAGGLEGAVSPPDRVQFF